MLFNNEQIHAIDVIIDNFTTLHIAEKRVGSNIMVVAECCRQFCEDRSFNNVGELCDHYHINNSDLRDSILRIIDFIDGKL